MDILENLNCETADNIVLLSLAESYTSLLYYLKVGYNLEEDQEIAKAMEQVIRYYAPYDEANDIIETAQKGATSMFASRVYKDLIGKMGD